MIYPTSYFAPSYVFGLQALDKRPEIDQHEHFIKQTLRSRCRILDANGIKVLTVPVHANSKTPIHEVRIDYSKDWIRDHERTLVSAYKSAPFFEHYLEEIQGIWNTRHDKLISLNDDIQAFLLRALDVEVNFQKTTTFHPYAQTDVRTWVNDQVIPRYRQVFQEKFGFTNDLCMLDLLFNLGKEAILYLKDELNPLLQPLFTIFDSNQARTNEH
jgi:hypothetical protein